MLALQSGITGLACQNWPTFIAQEKAFFGRVGLIHRTVSFRTMREGLEKVKSGSIPICTSAADTPILAINEGLPIKIIGALNRTAFGHLVARPEIIRIQNLAGKRIGTIDLDLGSTLVVREVLKVSGLGQGDYELIHVGGVIQRYDALLNNKIDATYLPPPYDFKSQDEGYRLLANCAEIFPEYAIAIYANQNFLSRSPETSIKFLRALVRAGRWLYDPVNKKEAVDILCNKTRTDQHYGKKAYDYIIKDSKGIAKDCRVALSGIKRLTGIMKKTDLIKRELPLSDYVDDIFLKRALESV